jgi:quercetin dioxygenase-like cupin family protein
MTPLYRTLACDVPAFELEEEIRAVRAELGIGRARMARALVKDGPLRITLVGLSAGGTLPLHKAEGPITIHVLDGAILLDAGGGTLMLPTGSLAALAGGVRHAVSAPQGGLFLLTIAAREHPDGPNGGARE